MTEPKPPTINAHDYNELTQAIGEVIVAWNACQESLFLLFWQLTEMPEYCAQAAFVILRSDALQRDITLAIANERYKHETPSGDQNDELRQITESIKRLGALSAERNAATHTMWEGLFTEKLWPSPHIIKHSTKLDRADALSQFQKLTCKLKNEHIQLNRIFMNLAIRPQPFAPEPRPRIDSPGEEL